MLVYVGTKLIDAEVEVHNGNYVFAYKDYYCVATHREGNHPKAALTGLVSKDIAIAAAGNVPMYAHTLAMNLEKKGLELFVAGKWKCPYRIYTIKHRDELFETYVKYFVSVYTGKKYIGKPAKYFRGEVRNLLDGNVRVYEFTQQTARKASFDGIDRCVGPCKCKVEPDGQCPKGWVSRLRAAQLI